MHHLRVHLSGSSGANKVLALWNSERLQGLFGSNSYKLLLPTVKNAFAHPKLLRDLLHAGCVDSYQLDGPLLELGTIALSLRHLILWL
jgi:hypothetical protein